MYKRYYDGYSSVSALPRRGEVITPRCAEEAPCKSEREEGLCRDLNSSRCSDECVCDTKTGCDSSRDTPHCPPSDCCADSKPKARRLLEGIEIDDIILLAIIIVMLKEDTGDSTLIIILGAIFLFGFID